MTITSLAGPVPPSALHQRTTPAFRRPAFLRKLLDGIYAARQRQADREIAAFIERNGGCLTDDVERQIGEAWAAGHRRSPSAY